MRPTLLTLATVTSKIPTTPSTTRLRKPPPLSLEHFIQRQRVISLWRTILRALYKIPKQHREEPLHHAKNEFERNKHVSDLTQIRYLISTGKTEFDGMRRYIDELAAR